MKLGRCDEARFAYDAALRGQGRTTSDGATAALAACAAR